jgi:predicted nuclease of predicted toxin-antitoxin system
MIPLLTDENVRASIIRALLQSRPELDLVRVGEVGLRATEDPLILEWAAEHGRVLLTHDRQTMTHHAYQRIRDQQEMIGVIVLDDQASPGELVPEILRAVENSSLGHLRNRVLFLSG